MENENKTQSKGLKVLKSVLNTVINIMIVVVLIVSIIIAVMALSSKANGISTLFGYTIQPIQSDSMKGKSPEGYPGGDFAHGDLMIAKATDFDPNIDYELGDIVTFKTFDSNKNVMLIAHRIVDVIKDKDGSNLYQTQGDNRDTSPVPDQLDEKEYISAWDIGSVFYSNDYQGKILKGWGKPIDFLKSQKGFFFVVLLPMIIFFMYELVRVVLNFSNYKKAVAEEEKEKAVKDALAEAKADGNENVPAELTPEQMEQFKKFLAQQNKQNPSDSDN